MDLDGVHDQALHEDFEVVEIGVCTWRQHHLELHAP
jgi:hypothetical protein